MASIFTFISSILFLVFLVWVFIEPDMTNFPFKKTSEQDKEISTETFTRTSIYFPSKHGPEKLHAWLFLPRNITNPQVIVAAHGFGAQKDFRIPAFAEGFAKSGYATFTFDYRNFGGSEGRVRNLVDINKHLEDWISALDYVLDKLENVSKEKIAIWGSSFGGGHVIVTAATYPRKERIQAVISQVPFIDGLDSVRVVGPAYGFPAILGVAAYSLKDLLRRTFGLSRQYAPLLNPEHNTIRLLPTEDCYSGYTSIIPKNPLGGWKNQLPASIFFEFPFYRPTQYAQDIACPVLVIAATKDSLCPESGGKLMSEKIKKVTFRSLDIGHFEPYIEKFDVVLEIEIQFLNSEFKK